MKAGSEEGDPEHLELQQPVFAMGTGGGAAPNEQ